MRRAVLFDVDGTLVDSLANLRRVWSAWADRHGIDDAVVWACATRTMPLETFAEIAPGHDPADCLAVLHELEDRDARDGDCRAFAGARELLDGLPREWWAVVTGNYAHRVETRFRRLGIPVPDVLVDAASVQRGKPDPQGYLAAAQRLGKAPADCLVIEDTWAGVEAGRRAGMTVWQVNGEAPNAAAHRSYPSLEAAVPDIRAWLLGPSS